MEYTNSVYNLIPKTYRVKLQRLQNRGLKIIFNGVHVDFCELHIMANLSPLVQSADKQLMMMMYRHSLTPDQYPRVDNVLPTRSHYKIRFDIPRPRVERFKRFLMYAGYLLWDVIAEEIQRLPSLSHFKSRINVPPDFDRYPVR